MTQAPPATAGWLLREIADGCRGVHVPADRADIARAVLRSALREGNWLPESLLATDASRYKSRTLHVDRESGITIRVLAWRRGQRTPIHDHIAWCVIGVYAGQERELRYSSVPVHGTPGLLLVGDHVMHASETAVLLPPDDIHEVSCITEDAVSVHIYGCALEGDAPSMRQAYEQSAVIGPLPFVAGVSTL